MAKSQTVPKIILIQKNQVASFDGALISIEKLRDLETKSLNADLYKEELKKHEGDLPPVPLSAETKGIWYGVGILTGMAICAIVRCF